MDQVSTLKNTADVAEITAQLPKPKPPPQFDFSSLIAKPKVDGFLVFNLQNKPRFYWDVLIMLLAIFNCLTIPV